MARFTGGVNDTMPPCSAKGCRTPATWVLAWNNPKLHTPDRRKTWLACDEHREHLSKFLGMRGFLKDVVPWAQWHEEHDGGDAPGTNAEHEASSCAGAESDASPGVGGSGGSGGSSSQDGPGSAADR